MTLAAELAEVVGEATNALTRLDAEALEELELRALNLQAIVRSAGRVDASLEIAARFRVFAEVMRATGENLRVIEGVAASRISGSASASRACGAILWAR